MDREERTLAILTITETTLGACRTHHLSMDCAPADRLCAERLIAMLAHSMHMWGPVPSFSFVEKSRLGEPAED